MILQFVRLGGVSFPPWLCGFLKPSQNGSAVGRERISQFETTDYAGRPMPPSIGASRARDSDELSG